MTALDLGGVCERRNNRQRMRHHGPVAVDACDLPLLLAWSWARAGYGGHLRRQAKESKRYWNEYLHRVIAGADRSQVVDHINGDVLDNRRCNLRACSQRQNAKNQPLRVDNTSGFKGVSRTRTGRYVARLNADGTRFHIGTFDNSEDAAAAYNVAAVKWHGDYARLNALSDRLATPRARGGRDG